MVGLHRQRLHHRQGGDEVMAIPILPKGIKGFGASIIDEELHISIVRDIKGVDMWPATEFDAQVQKALIDCTTHIRAVGLA